MVRIIPFGRNRPVRLESLAGDHADDCARLHAAAFPHPWGAHEFERLLGGANALGTCALDGRSGALLGFILSRRAADEAEILTVTVDAACRRRGIGTKLLAATAASLGRYGVKTLFLEVGETNAAARRLYAASGFAEVGRRPSYYRTASGGAVAALVMRRALE